MGIFRRLGLVTAREVLHVRGKTESRDGPLKREGERGAGGDGPP